MFIEPDDLAHSVFEAFKMNDVEAALEFTLDSEDYEDLFSNYTLDESEKKRLIDKHNETYVKKLQERFRKWFRAIIDDGAKKGAVWKDVKFESRKGPDQDKPFHGAQAGEIYVFFSYKERHFRLTLDDCFLTSRVWLMSDESGFKRVIDE